MYSVYCVAGPTGLYVGITNDPVRRWQDHAKDKARNHFHNAIRKYGPENFSLVVVAGAKTRTDALACEKQLVAQYRKEAQPLYNATEGGDGVTGHEFTAEQRQRMSLAHKGKPVPEHVRALLRSYLGPLGAETKRKIGEANRGKIRTQETKDKLSAAAKARDPQTRIPSEETRKKLSAAAKLREARKKLAQSERIC